MKKIILIVFIIAINFSCKAQKNKINSNELTINGINFIGNNVSLLIQHLGQPNAIEDFYLEMDEVMSQKYIYNGVSFTTVNNEVSSFEITSSSFSFTSHEIKVGDNINTLESIYPISYSNKGQNWLGLLISDKDYFITIFFDETTQQINKIRKGSN